MKQFILIILSVLMVSCVTTKHPKQTNNTLDGTWLPIKQEIAGNEMPAAAYENYTLIISKGTYAYGMPNKADKGTITYSNGKMDIYGKEGPNNGKHYTAIYKQEGNQLTICYNLSGDSYPDRFDTQGKQNYFLSVYNKQM